MDLTEDELIGAITRVLSGTDPEVVVPVGDDAAVVRAGSGDLVLTTDSLVEGAHFLADLSTPRDLGHRAIAVNVSDVAAMGASPRYALCALVLSDAVDSSWVMDLFGGMREACERYACTLVGGNLAKGSEVSITVTLTGEVAPGRACLRSGARPGDVLVVTGELGSAAAGRRIRERRGGWDGLDREAIRRAERPEARVGEAQILVLHGATAMMDVSDGLALDLSRLCAASGAGSRVTLADLPVGPRATLDEALGGGEDYELLATMPSIDEARSAASALEESFGLPLTVIGTVIEGAGVRGVTADGIERSLDPSGWDHFG
jgi:thiamine-monophosphate kinase